MPVQETINYRGHNIQIIQDDNAESPDTWEDEQVFIVYDHRQFYVKRKGFEPRDIFEFSQENPTKKLFDGYWFFGVDAYIHSGVALSLANETSFPDRQWDVSTTVYMLVKREKGWTWSREKAEAVARGHIETWNQYLSGDVWGYEVEDVHSCWGFYGDEGKEQMISDAKSLIDYYIKDKRKDHWQQLKTWIKNKVPLLYRKPLTEIDYIANKLNW